MTQYQARQIREARQRGAGYRAIASVVGLDRDTVRNYCKRYGLDSKASGEEPAGNCGADDSSVAPLRCPCCGQEIEQPKTGRRRKFCSEKCRRKWWSGHSDSIAKSEQAQYPAVCAACGKTFVTYGNAHRKYCCWDCYAQVRYHRSSIAEAIAPARQHR